MRWTLVITAGTRRRRAGLVLLVLAFLAGCARGGGSSQGPEATSLLGRPLEAMPLADDVRRDREAKLDAARRAYEQDPDDEERLIWYGRRTAYLGRYREAIAIYTEGLRRHPESYKLRRHRGHRYLTVRRLDDAVEDLTRAAELAADIPDEVEADGLPNRMNLPTSTSHTNIYYHLGLAHYLQGDDEAAQASYRACMSFAKNDDMRCATAYWLYLTLRRLQREDEARAVLAPMVPDMDVIENTTYLHLLLLFKGEMEVRALTTDPDAPVGAAIDDATLAYGIASWHRLAGDAAAAEAALEEIVAGTAWPAFGHLAAEAELARQRRPRRTSP